MIYYAYSVHDAPVRPRAPRLRLALVALAALAAFGILVVARPDLHGPFWQHGDDLALVGAWCVAAAASAWLFLATTACLVALGRARPGFARRLAPALPRGLRHLVEIAIVTTCIAVPTLPAVAAPRTPVAAVVLQDQPVVRAAPAPSATVTPPVSPVAPAPALASARVVVRPGDSLWLIARAALLQSSAGPPGDAQVAHYWRAVIATNRSTLRSGDPSLIFPGEIVALPPI